ncbi:MAG TPA: DUF2231 domain-containing protein [Rugosimonospora sp.]|nr:DUF2231 domain-containing protein [Rugosimonospora sp.]
MKPHLLESTLFETVLGIPAHPLLVHAAVVFVPLLILVTLAYGLLPGFRKRVDWAVVALAIGAPGAAFLAKQSGEAFKARLIRENSVSPQDLASISTHQNFGTMTFWFTCGLAVIALALVGMQFSRRRRHGTSRAFGPVTLILVVLAIAASGVTGYYVFKTGDTGAHIVWQGR